ncbi:CPBP family intramembrane metalloprotease [Salinispirillum sp. LH 10-3-1]|uniref:CPBP family intramembrane metalloprotease n=1 Tax=Salinispirillum sp. LH 10-3-1 TaxID=2952525 RepID=A0AB38YF56_9GAMM
MTETTKQPSTETAESHILLETEQPKSVPTLGKSLAWLFVFAVLFYGAAVVYGMVYGGYLGSTQPDLIADEELFESTILDAMLSPSGIATTSLLQALLIIPVLLWASHFAHQPWRETLAFRAVPLRMLGFWVLVYCGYFVAQSLLELVAPSDLGDIMTPLAGSKHLGLAFALIVLAPLIEELIFRGYLFTAWRHTKLGLWGTVILTSLIFTSIHAAQYSGLLLLYLFIFSVILGLAREKTGSIWAPIALHVLNNSIAVFTLVYLGLH